MKSRPHSSTRRVSRHNFLFNLVQATLGEPRLVGRTSAVCKIGTPLRPTPTPHLKPGHRSPPVSHSAPYRGRRHARNRRSQVTPGISLRDLRAYVKLAAEQEDIALEKSIEGAVLLEEVTHTPSPEWKVVDDIAVEFLESQTKPEWGGGEQPDALGIKRNSLVGTMESKIPAFVKQIPKSTSPLLTPTSIPLFTIPTVPISAQIPTQIPTSAVVPVPAKVPSTKLKMPSKSIKGAAKSDDTAASATTPRSTKSTGGRKNAASKDNASKAGGNTGPNAKGGAGKKGAAATADAKGNARKGPAEKPLVGAKNADKPVKNAGKAAPAKDVVERKPAAKGGAKKPNPAPAPAKNTGRPKSPPAGGKKVSFKGPPDPPARGRGGPAPRSSRSTMSGGPALKASKSTPAGKGDISIEKYTQQIIKLKKTLQENSSIVTILEKQLMLDSQGKPQSEADVLLREQVVRLDMDLQCAKARMKELEDMYVSEKLARERDCKTIKMLEAARDELQKVVQTLQLQEKAMKEAYESKVGVLTTTVTGLQMAQQEQNRLRFEEARSQFSFIPQNSGPSPPSSFSTVQTPKPLVIPATFALAQQAAPIPFTPGPGTTFGYTSSSPTLTSKPASLPSSPVAPASGPALLPGQAMAAVGSTDDKLPTDINTRCLALESKLKEAEEALNKEWKERVELEEKYNLEKKERIEIEQQLAHERKERIALEEKSKLDQFNKTQLEARLAIVERDLANYRKVPDSPQPVQWPPSQVGLPKPSPTPSLIKSGASGVGAFHSIKMRLAEAGIQ